MSERFESLEAFKATDERRRTPAFRLVFFPKVGDNGAAAWFLTATSEVYLDFSGSDEVELLGTVASAQLADALLRLPASTEALLPWVRQRIENAPTDEAEIATAIADHRRVWAVYDPTQDRPNT